MESRHLRTKRNETVQRILEAATEIFAEVGFAGARVDEIAKRAQVNKATIYYRIGDKRALYARVLHDVFADTAGRIALNIEETQSPQEKLRTYIHNIARTLHNHPHIAPIMMQELASGGKNVPEVVGRDFARILGLLSDILEEGAKKGVFIETIPFILHLMVVGPLMFCKNIELIRSKRPIPSELLEKLDRSVSGMAPVEVEGLLLRAIKS
jgi:AcrR family transcriptional regulator